MGDMHLIPGSAFGRYLIESRLGEGSIGVVYLASDPTLGRRVALKLLSPALAADPDFRSRFVADARSAAALDHPHVLPVYEAGERNGQLYLATRYVPGLDLGTLIAREGALSVQRAGLFLAQIASALDAAHASGLVHRNVKPSNILIAAGEHAYLADFGFAALADSNRAATRSGQPLKVEYLAPELLSGTPATPRSDIYALGCSFVECLTGTPSRHDTQGAAQGHVPGPAMSTRKSDLPRALAPVIARALAERAEDRYATATEFAAAAARASGLAAATAGTAFSSYAGPRPPDSTPQIASSQRKRVARLLLAAAASLAVVGTTAIAIVAYGSNQFSALTPSLRAPTTSLEPSPTAIALAHIGLRAEELILPLSEFPFTGYNVPRDEAADATGWVRRYRAGITLAAPFYDSALQVWPKADGADAFLGTWLVSCPTARSTPLSESSRACVKREAAPAVSSVTLLLIVRNVSVVLTASPSVLASDDDAEMRLGELVAIGRAQRAWIDRIAPEDGSSPTRPLPVPTPRIVTLQNEQIALPLADFPLRGYSIGADGVNTLWWYREFISPETRAPRQNRKIAVFVQVRPSALAAESLFTVGSKCEGAPGSAGITYQQLPTTIGDHASACLRGVPNAPIQGIQVYAVWRNVVVLLDSDITNEPVDVRIEELATVARSQFAVIDRVAPP